MAPRKQTQQKQTQVIRIFNTDIDGSKHVLYGLRAVHGVSLPVAHGILHLANIPKDKTVGDLSDKELEKLEDLLKRAHEVLPTWMLNRRKDYDTGDDKHLYSADLTFETEKDVRRLKRTKSYRGMRHQAGLPMRGQRTRSNFRRNKGKASGVKKARK